MGITYKEMKLKRSEGIIFSCHSCDYGIEFDDETETAWCPVHGSMIDPNVMYTPPTVYTL